MDSVFQIFQDRLHEIDAYLDFLQTLETCAQDGIPKLDGAAKPITSLQQRILYSSFYLQLYNLIESTMSGCMAAITEAAVEDGRWKPSDLSESLKSQWVRASARTHENLSPENRLKYALSMFDHLAKSLPIECFEVGAGGGGNWDDSAIEAFSKRVGCRLNVSKPVYSAVKRPFRDELGSLAVIKELRNQLAHGAISFAQCAEEMTVGRLIDLKDRTVAYLQEVLRCFSLYLESFQYLRPERRPT